MKRKMTVIRAPPCAKLGLRLSGLLRGKAHGPPKQNRTLSGYLILIC